MSDENGPSSKVTIDDVIEALYGPRCLKCNQERTNNPSKVCSQCLGARCCSKCKGSGQRVCSQGWPTGCGSCSGTGVRRIITR